MTARLRAPRTTAGEHACGHDLPGPSDAPETPDAPDAPDAIDAPGVGGALGADEQPDRRRNPAVWVCIALIRGYQVARAGRVSLCRFTPSCSQYALEAIDRHGARRGIVLAARRLARCRPGGPFGLDPVPE